MTIPVTLIAGFLGSGKTTLVQRILKGSHGIRCAVIVNEFGEVGIDGDLLHRGDLKRAKSGGGSAVVELANGCICCEIQDDLRTTLLDLVGAEAAGQRLDRILVEASGAASPGPAAQTFLIDGVLQERVHLDGVVTLAHAGLIEHLLGETAEAEAQIAYADRILLNHADRAEPEDVAELVERLRLMNPLADVRTAVRADVPLDWVLGSRASAVSPAISAPDPAAALEHTAGLRSVSLVAEGAVDVDALVIWLEFLSKRRSHELMRAKGVVAASGKASGQASGKAGVPHKCLVIQGVYRWLEVTDGEGEAPSESRLVLIGRNLDEAEVRRGWAAITRAR